ncbi:LysR family transcriptional regulator [Asticcacaulis machinosus]|uniref:LysR family transcriptional regulator n=1 Tax=Asticcacaulis machinosus TaxID=2984211 RepID=A0ABT5HML9_9CAUL|nr:LysR family transcriptional regulator [Asticcacaulis machinosus]MDC7677497.1 LysR family transcriptional regulator [Asticcacaulis machinosus]
MSRLDPNDLSTFIAIARQKSFRKASEELGVTASALSHAMRTLEERLGVRLLNRTTRSVALTEAGQRLYDRVTPAFRDIDDAIEDLNRFRDRPAGSIRINAARLACHLVLLPLLSGFTRSYPDVSVEVVSDNALSDIVGKGFDAGVRFGEALAADMIAIPLGPRKRFSVVASPEFLTRHGVPKTPHDLRHFPCIRYRFDSGALYRWEFERGPEAPEVEVAGPVTVNDLDLMVRPALDGLGLAYVFEEQVAAYIQSGQLVEVLSDWCPYYPGFFLYYPSRRQMPAALRAFVDHVRAQRF